MLKKKLVLLLTPTLTSGIHKQPHSHCIMRLNDKHGHRDVQQITSQSQIHTDTTSLALLTVCFDPLELLTKALSITHMPLHENTLQNTHKHFLKQGRSSLLSINRQVPRDAHNTHRYTWNTRECSKSLPLLPLYQGHSIMFCECWSLTQGSVPAWCLYWRSSLTHTFPQYQTHTHTDY